MAKPVTLPKKTVKPFTKFRFKKRREANGYLSEQISRDKSVLPPGIEVVGRTPEKSGWRVVMKVQSESGDVELELSVVELATGELGKLAAVLAENGYLCWVKRPKLNELAEALLGRASTCGTVVVAAIGLTRLEIRGATQRQRRPVHRPA